MGATGGFQPLTAAEVRLRVISAEHLGTFENCPTADSTAMKARIMTRTGRANSIIGGIILVLLVLALGYYFTGNQENTAEAPGAPAATDTTNTGSTTNQ